MFDTQCSAMTGAGCAARVRERVRPTPITGRGAIGTRVRYGAVVACVLTACAGAPLPIDAPKVMESYPLRAYALHEECLQLAPGDRLDYRFTSTAPVDFNIHYHEGRALIMPVVREKTREAAGVYPAPFNGEFCLQWEAGEAGASLDYRMRLRPASP